MKIGELFELVTVCNHNTSCIDCKYTDKCKEFKRVIETIKEPYELPRLFEMERK